jgi:phosphatidate cytidylyltransferase
MIMDSVLLKLFAGILGILVTASVISAILRVRVKSEGGRKVVENLVARTNAWWVMAALFAVVITLGRTTTLVMFAFASFFALREFITLTPTRRGDHRSLFWAFFIILPLHYWTLGTNWYGLFVLLIPVYAYLFIPMRSALAGDTEHFLERTSKVQWGLMVAVYFLSYAPALLILEIPSWSVATPERNARLIFFLVFVVQISDVMQYVWGKLCGKHPIVPKLSPNKTVEGFIGGGLTATLIGGSLWWATPFSPLAAAGLSAVIVVMGFFGGLVMSAIKRDRGVKDYGDLIPGHGGVMDRVDSLCFAAPVFFHIVRWVYQ